MSSEWIALAAQARQAYEAEQALPKPSSAKLTS